MAIFIVGLVWPRANQPGALGGFLIGLLLAAARFATEYIYESPACGEVDTRPAFASINYMYFGKCTRFAVLRVETLWIKFWRKVVRLAYMAITALLVWNTDFKMLPAPYTNFFVCEVFGVF